MRTRPPQNRFRRFLYENSLVLTCGLLALLSLGGQIGTGWSDYNDDLEEMKLPRLTLPQYLHSGHFCEATFENWESEFLQMGLYVLLTVWLRQRGSAESRKLYGEEEVDREPDPKRPGAPWPVRAGGVWLWLYRRSLTIALLALFVASFLLHARGGAIVYSIEQQHEGKPAASTLQYMGTARFWFESTQNWQSEFVSITAIVGLSVFLRQQGSPESKPVDASSEETGD